jgi:hypothetical protein
MLVLKINSYFKHNMENIEGISGPDPLPSHGYGPTYYILCYRYIW